MPPLVALLGAAIFVAYSFYRDSRRFSFKSSGLTWPTLWYLVSATHAIGAWFVIWGLPLPLATDDPTEGSFIDRCFFAALAAIGIGILARRQFDWRQLLRANRWFFLLVGFAAISVLWSNYPYVSFKRYIKLIGALVMAVIVLDQERPFEAMLAVLRRVLYVHLPMSIVCIKYFRHIGVNFDWNGVTECWQGIATSKNTLGQVALIGVLCFLWEVRREWPQKRWKNVHVVYLLMSLYLLKGSEESISMTSLSVCLLAVVIFFRLQGLHSSLTAARKFTTKVFATTVALVGLVLIHSIVLFPKDSVFGGIIAAIGRDITLTDRTYIWHDVYAAAGQSPIFGLGYGGFWIGRLANIPWNAHMTWVLGQSHSGYIDTFLQLGVVGFILLCMVQVTTLSHLSNELWVDFNAACFHISLWITVLVVNITETTFLSGDHQLWFVFLLTSLSVRVPQYMLTHRPIENEPQTAHCYSAWYSRPRA